MIKKLMVGALQSNCYLYSCPETKETIVIDPGDDAPQIAAEINRQGLKIKYIVLTHGHMDHIGAVDTLRNEFGAKVLIHKDDADCLTDPANNLSVYFSQPVRSRAADELLSEGLTIRVGTQELAVIHTPGHTPGGICLSFPGGVFTGDTLFASGIGRTDFPGGSMEALLGSIKQKLLKLPPETVIYPGHGPDSTIGEEIDENPFL